MTQVFSLAECRKILALGLPIFFGAMANTGMNFADTVMSGQYSAEALAAVAVAGSVFVPFVMFANGLLLALPSMTAQLVGAKKYRRAGHLLRQGIWLSMAMACVLIPLLYLCSRNMTFFGVGPELAPTAGGYLRALLPGLAGAMVFGNLRGFMDGFGRTRPGMVVGILALCLNIPCNYAFIYGAFGMPELGAVGCGVATSICFWFTGLALVVFVKTDRRFRALRPLSPRRRDRVSEDGSEIWPLLDFALIAFILRVGLPSACSLFVEICLFAGTAILLAPMGAMMVAGHQITLSYSFVPFMVPMAVGATTTIVVGQYLGARRLAHAQTAATTALIMGMTCGVLIMIATITFRHEIARLYNDDPRVLSIAATLFLLCGTYQVLDAFQHISMGILRGCNDTRTIMLVCFLAYGVVGMSVSLILGRTDLVVPAMGATGFWIGYNAALFTAGACYVLRLRHLRRLRMRDIQGRLAS